jgi:hypothetical protein
MTIDSLIKSTDLIGRTVLDPAGGRLATIREVFLHKQTGEALFVILDTGGLFGAGGKFHPVPWRLLRFDAATDAYAASLTKDQLKNAPAYDRDQLNSAAYGWGEQIDRFFDSESGSIA